MFDDGEKVSTFSTPTLILTYVELRCDSTIQSSAKQARGEVPRERDSDVQVRLGV